MKKISKKDNILKRHYKIRKVVIGSKERPRMSVYKSNRNLYVQLIDDQNSQTLIGISSKSLKLKQGANKEAAQKLGLEIAKQAKAKNISTVVFDRGGNLYHGVIAKLADAAREGGLKF